MIGLIVGGMSLSVLPDVFGSIARGIYAFWSNHDFEEIIESASDDLLEKKEKVFAYQEELIPFLAGERVVSIRTTLALGCGPEAMAFMVNGGARMIASSDLRTSALFDFYRAVCFGRDVNLRWYASRIEEMAGFAEWSLWSELPDPTEGGDRKLLLARDYSTLVKIHDKIHNEVEKNRMAGADVFPSESNGGLSFVDVASELTKAAEQYG